MSNLFDTGLGVLDTTGALGSKNLLLANDALLDNAVVLDKSALDTPEAPGGKDITQYVDSVYWIESPNNRSRINFLPYKDDNYAHLLIKYKSAALGKKVTIKIFELDSVSDDFIVERSRTVSATEVVETWSLDGKAFAKGGESEGSFFAHIIVDNAASGDFDAEANLLKIHVVRYIPDIMRANGWTAGAALQKFWFEGQSSNRYQDLVSTDIIRYAHFLQFDRFKTLHDGYVSDRIWANAAGRGLFKDRMNELINSNQVKLPEEKSIKLKFGNTSKTIVRKDGEQVPEFEKYYVQSRPYEQPLSAPLDDLYAALGNFNFRILIFGTIEFTENNTYKVSVNKVGFYIKDKFDYEGSQELGDWNPSNNKVSKFIMDNGYYDIENSSYRRYRELSGKGADFGLFSDIYTIPTNDTFELGYTIVSDKRLLTA